MPDSALPPCSILLLAGGRGQRMGGRDKGLIEWQGLPLIAHLHRLVRPLTDDLIVSCNRNQERYAAYADRLVSDDSRDFPGPLAGIPGCWCCPATRRASTAPCWKPCCRPPAAHRRAPGCCAAAASGNRCSA